MTLDPYSLIELLTDQYQDQGVIAGAIGTILEVYGTEAYEIEFSREDGSTIAWFAIPQTQVKPYTDRKLLSIPPQPKSA
jgi:hypothetical protein